jgi:peptide deformylase
LFRLRTEINRKDAVAEAKSDVILYGMTIITDEKLLRRPCEDVLPDEVGALVSTLENELNRANRLGKSGIGLAASQIGILKRAAIIRIDNIKIDLVNAKIDKFYDEILFRDEGCLSFPGKNIDTVRHQEVHIINNLVYPNSFIATGFIAIACSHEIDHYNSVLFIDREVPKSKPIVVANKVGPNDPCPCGKVDLITGRPVKFKRCCKK